ncbi:hypothetical protein Tco_0185321 [Tanacetum coccineum]
MILAFHHLDFGFALTLVSRCYSIIYYFTCGQVDSKNLLDWVSRSSVGSSKHRCIRFTHAASSHTETFSSSQHVIKALIHVNLASHLTKSLFDAGSSRFSIVTGLLKYHSDVSGRSQDNA